jgi:ABC-2 type transport system permease protein
MGEIEGIYQIWLREVKRNVRYKSRIVTSIVSPIIWILIFGVGLGSSIRIGIPVNYESFIYPGIIGQTILFTSMMGGIGIIIDKQYGILKELMVAPLSRPSIIFGKALGISTNAILQVSVLLILSFIVNISLSISSFVLTLIIAMLIAIGMSGLGLFLASLMESTEGFSLVMTFITMPIFLLSGALFPVSGALPNWLSFIVYLDPLTYGVDALRGILINNANLPMHIDLIAVLIFAIFTISLSAIVFTKREQNLM